MSGLLREVLCSWVSAWHRESFRRKRPAQNRRPGLRPLRLELMEARALLSVTVASQPAAVFDSSHAAAAPVANVADFAHLNEGAQNAMPATIAGRYVFYNNSCFDAENKGRTDDDAIATDKTALLPGEKATFANYTSYSRGINGIIVDIADAAGPITAADFQFKVGNGDDASTWATASTPTVSTRLLADQHTTRVTLTWADNAIQQQWLQVEVLATAATALATPEVFYFGNAIGESGDSPADASVTPGDALIAASHTQAFKRLAATSPYDYNRDGVINATDAILALNSSTAITEALQLITPVPMADAGVSDQSNNATSAGVTVVSAAVTALAPETGNASGFESNAATTSDSNAAPVLADVQTTVCASFANRDLCPPGTVIGPRADSTTDRVNAAAKVFAATSSAAAVAPTIDTGVHGVAGDESLNQIDGKSAAIADQGASLERIPSIDRQRCVQTLMAALSDSDENNSALPVFSRAATATDAVFASLAQTALL
ncbi:MAG: hypothetical protein LLG00_14725 [Planctomycetaceae bacterium]|nr:hypothetical protein [Planctomycetaceae bacterium]